MTGGGFGDSSISGGGYLETGGKNSDKKVKSLQIYDFEYTHACMFMSVCIYKYLCVFVSICT